jgi:intracellular septation protein
MKLLFDFFPIILFFVSFYQAKFLIDSTFIGNLVNPERPEHINATIIATGIAIVATFIQVGYNWFSNHKIERMHIFSLALITVLGGITIILADPAFIQWKPTVLNWAFAAAFFLSIFIGEKNLVERMMGSQLDLPDYVWTRLNLSWVAFFLISGTANLYVAFYYDVEALPDARMQTWVNFKLFGLMGLTIIFVILQAIYLARFIQEEEEDEAGEKSSEQ